MAISWAWPRSSAPMPGKAPGVSIRQMIGSRNLAASFILFERLAIALRVGAAVEARLPFLERVALLVADEQDLEVAEPGEAGADGPVVAEGPVAVQLDELVEDQLDVVERLRPVRVPGDEDRLPGRQGRVDLRGAGRSVRGGCGGSPRPASGGSPADCSSRASALLQRVDVRLERQRGWHQPSLRTGSRAVTSSSPSRLRPSGPGRTLEDLHLPQGDQHLVEVAGRSSFFFASILQDQRRELVRHVRVVRLRA